LFNEQISHLTVDFGRYLIPIPISIQTSIGIHIPLARQHVK